MTVLLGLWFSIAVGVSDYFGGYVTRRWHAFSTVANAALAGVIVSVVLVFIVPSVFDGRSLVFGIASGIALGFALSSMYRGLSLSSAAVVSPIVAVLMAIIPVGWDVVTGGSLPAIVVIGSVVAVVGLVCTTVSPELGDRVRLGVVWGVVGGMLFGVALTFLGTTHEDAGLWPVVGQRGAAALVLASAATLRHQPIAVPTDLRTRAWFSGAIGATGIAAFAVGAQGGSLTEITIASTMFPAVTAVLSTVFDAHPMRWWQLLGIGGCIAGVTLIGIS